MNLYKTPSAINEIKKAREFINGTAPLSFKYQQKPFPEGFKIQNERFCASSGKLFLSYEYKLFEESSAVEWTPYFENRDNKNSGIISGLFALDRVFSNKDGKSGEAVVSFCKGTGANIDDFAFCETVLGNEPLIFESVGSRGFLPFFNLDLGGEGILFGLGFTSKWKMTFEKTENGVHVTISMPETHFYLLPGEHVRNIKVLVMFWEGEKNRSYNMFRNHLVRNHILCDENGEPFPPICCNVWGGLKTENHLKYIDYIKKNNLNYDCYWIDAGWYGEDHETEEYQDLNTNDWFKNQGIWRVNRTVHPDTLKPVSEAAHSAGMKFLLWYDLFNCVEGIGWQKEHPEWGKFDGPHTFSNKEPAKMISLLNINNPEARNWLLATLEESMKENGVDYYREDPPPINGGEDEENRTGVSDMHAVENLYAFWDNLHKNHPGILIDNCGGGGSRIDLETISRTYVLWRTDYNCSPTADPISNQAGNYGLAHFVPLVNGASPKSPGNTYAFHSSLYGGMGIGLYHLCGFEEPKKPWEDDSIKIDWFKKAINVYRLAKPFLSGDFYPLTPCTVNTDDTLSYQNDRPDMNEGLIFAFFRQDCTQNSLTVEPVLSEGDYVFTNMETDENFRQTVKKGFTLTVTSSEKPSSTLLHYKKLQCKQIR